MSDSVDTWGISGEAFLTGFFLAALLSLGIGVLIALKIPPKGEEPTRSPRPLSPPEIGMLSSEPRAVAAALATLRAADLIGPRARPGPLPPDPFTRLVYDETQNGGYSRLVWRLRYPLHVMRRELIEMGFVAKNNSTAVQRVGLLPVCVFMFGGSRVIAGVNNGKPVGYLIVMMVALAIGTAVVSRFAAAQKCTALGRAELKRLQEGHRHLSPRMRPSFATYGPPMAGLSAALFGIGALQLLDPGLVTAAGLRLNSTDGGMAILGGDGGGGGGSNTGSVGGTGGGGDGGGGGGCGG